MIREYLQQRTPRERVLLLTMAALVILLLLYSLIIEPLVQSRAELTDVVERNRQIYTSIRAAAAEARALRRGNVGASSSRGQEAQGLIGQIEQSARQKGLADNLKRIQPTGKSEIGIWFEQSRFETLLGWLAEMEHQYGIEVKSLEIERTGAGIVNARVVLGS